MVMIVMMPRPFPVRPDEQVAKLELRQEDEPEKPRLFDALAEEALRRYLKDMNVPISVREALHASLRAAPANDPRPKVKSTRKR